MAAAPEALVARSARLTIGEILRDQTALRPDAIAIEVERREEMFRFACECLALTLTVASATIMIRQPAL